MIDVLLPWPPSVNLMWRMIVIKGKARMILSAEGRKYQTDALAAILSKHGVLQPMAGRLSVRILAFAPNRIRRDIDNLLKGILDALKAGRVIKDDSQIDTLSITRDGLRLVPGGLIEVRVEKIPEAANLLSELT